MLKINEIFYSIQGESSAAGLPTTFVRLTGCNLRCTYCDTEYAFYEGEDFTVEEAIQKVKEHGCKLVEVTGGEPLMQKDVFPFMTQLCDKGFDVMLETSGSLPIEKVDKRVKIIMDLKTPSSGMMNKNLYENIEYLKPNDEVKFVIGTQEDYNWSKEQIEKFGLTEKANVLFSPVFNSIEPKQIVEWILNDKLNVRFQLQMHKYIWEPETRGV